MSATVSRNRPSMRPARPLALLLVGALLAGCQLFRPDPVESVTTPVAPLCAPGQPYFARQVDLAARFLADSVTLAPGTPYPSEATPRGGDTVTVQFIVGVDGRVETGTVRIQASSPRAGDDVLAAAEGWRYAPARLGNCPVRQLVTTGVARYER